MCHGAVIPKIVSNSFVSCNGAPPRSGCISRTRRLQPAAEQAAHPLQRPAQAASRITQIPCDPWRFRKDLFSRLLRRRDEIRQVEATPTATCSNKTQEG